MESGFEKLTLLVALGAALTSSSATEGEIQSDERFPAEIKTVGVVMPASVLDRSRFVDSILALQKVGCRVKLARRLSFEPRASVEDRVADFEEMWLDPEVDLVMCARGGVGCEEVVDRLDWAKLATRPGQRLVGFSNVTVLLSAMLKRRIGRPYSGPNFGTVGTSKGDTIPWLCRMLAGLPVPDAKLRAIVPGAFSGKSCGGHIGLVRKCIDSGWFPDASNRVVFLERNNSTTVDGIRRELNAIADSGCLAHAAGVVFGDVTPGMTDSGGSWGTAKPCVNPKELEAQMAALEEVKADFARKVGCPVYDGFAYGHIPVMHTIDFERVVRVSEDGVMSWDN